jgi:hypothetical protein
VSLSGLAAIAAADHQAILNADGCVVTLHAPDGRTAALRGNQRDIAHAVDPETGKTVSARTVSVALSMLDLALVNMAPTRELDADTNKPWVVTFAETVGAISQTFIVAETIPDRTIGCLVLILEFYESAPPT